MAMQIAITRMMAWEQGVLIQKLDNDGTLYWFPAQQNYLREYGRIVLSSYMDQRKWKLLKN